MNLTEWYPSYMKPARKGVYQVSTQWYRYWDGCNWYCGEATAREAFTRYFEGGNTSHLAMHWRGLAPPSGK